MDKIVIVTGSSSGIGYDTCLNFAEHGYDVVGIYHKNHDQALELKKMILSMGRKCEMFSCDISVEEETKALIEKVLLQFHHIDVLVNSAGISIDNNICDKTYDEFMSVVGVNLGGTFLMCKYVSKAMLEVGNGRIINISSTNGIDTNYKESMDYDASKAGVISLTRNLALEFDGKILVNCVCPGWIDTKMNLDMNPLLREKEMKKILVKRFGTVREISDVIYFLASNGNYINGSIIRVDGGYGY